MLMVTDDAAGQSRRDPRGGAGSRAARRLPMTTTTTSRAAGDARISRVRDRAAALGLEGLLVTHLANVYYLTGLRASAAAVLVDAGRVTLVTDARYVTAARALADSAAAPAELAVTRVQGSYDEAIRDLVRERGLARVGVEAGHLTVARWQWLCDSLAGAATLVPTEGVVEAERLVKDAAECERLRTAGRLLADLVPPALDRVRAGRTEREVAADVEHALALAGFDDRAFETIVASGPRSALPHARPTRRRLGAGDLVVLDFGGVYDGYCVDLTRTACVGRSTDEATRLHAAVLAAQTAAIAAVRPGIPASRIDAAARSVLEQHGLAEAFGHGTGHGLGIEVHEAPRLAPARQLRRGADVVLEAGMAFTIEPGVYLPGTGGVRIEDDVLVTAAGCEVLTDVSRVLTVC